MLAAVEKIRWFIGNQIARVGVVEEFDYLPYIGDLIDVTCTFLKFIFGDFLGMFDSFGDVHFDNF